MLVTPISHILFWKSAYVTLVGDILTTADLGSPAGGDPNPRPIQPSDAVRCSII